MLILGLGPIASNFVSGRLTEMFATARDDKGAATAVDFNAVFLVPCVTAAVAALLLLLFFHPPKKAEASG